MGYVSSILHNWSSPVPSCIPIVSLAYCRCWSFCIVGILCVSPCCLVVWVWCWIEQRAPEFERCYLTKWWFYPWVKTLLECHILAAKIHGSNVFNVVCLTAWFCVSSLAKPNIHERTHAQSVLLPRQVRNSRRLLARSIPPFCFHFARQRQCKQAHCGNACLTTPLHAPRQAPMAR